MEQGTRRRRSVAIAGALGATIGPAIVHAAHDQDHRANVSAGLRFGATGLVAAAFGGYYLGCVISDVSRSKLGDGHTKCLSGNVAWAAIGLTFVASAVVDYALTKPIDATSTRMLSVGIRF